MDVFPVPGGPTRQRIGLEPFFVRMDCQVFKHPLFDLFKSVMILLSTFSAFKSVLSFVILFQGSSNTVSRYVLSTLASWLPHLAFNQTVDFL